MKKIKNNFISYEKIATNSNKWIITEKDYRDWKKINWVVTEKIHGANFCILADKDNICSAKRKSILQPNDNFFHYQKILLKYKNNIFDIFAELNKKNPHIESIYVYGEIFGGKYPHPKILNKNTQPVQTGVYYSPNIEFIVFDIAYYAQKERIFIEYNLLTEVCSNNQIPYVTPIYIGSYEKAMAFNHKFETTIPKQLGYPEIANNYAEGIVIKPETHITIQTKKGTRVRPITKKKIVEFSETKYDEAQKWSPQKNSYLELALLYITKNRLQNVLSKIGKVNFNNVAERKNVVEHFVMDILEQMQDDYSEIFDKITESNKLTQEVSDNVDIFLGEYCE